MRFISTLAVAGLLAVSMAPATSAQPIAAVFGPPRPEPRAGSGAPFGDPFASNSVVVVAAETCKTPWQLVSEHPLLSGVAKAVRSGNDSALWALLNDPDAPVTVLAPDNQALAAAAKALGIPLSAALNGSEPMVSAILRNHVLNTTEPLSKLGPDSTVTSFAGAPVRVFSPTLVAERKANKSRKAAATAPTDDKALLAPAPAPSKKKEAADKASAAVDPAEPVPRRRSSRRALSEATTYVNKDATGSSNSLNTPDPNVGGSAIVSTVVDLANSALGGNSSAAAASGGNSTGSGVSPVDALLNSFISLFAGIMGGGSGDGNSGLMGAMMGGGNSSGLFMSNPSSALGPGWKVSKRRGCAGGCSRVSDWTFAPVGKTAASSLPDNATFAVLRNATVMAGNVRTCGGYLQVVDGVLVPELLSKKEKKVKGTDDPKIVVLELGDGDGAAVSRVSVPLDRSLDDETGAPRANVTVEYLGKVAKAVAARDKEAAAAAAAAAKKKAAASPAPAPAAAAKKAAAADEDVVVAAPAPAPEVSQASVPASKKAPDAPKVVGETIAPKGAKPSPSA